MQRGASLDTKSLIVMVVAKIAGHDGSLIFMKN